MAILFFIEQRIIFLFLFGPLERMDMLFLKLSCRVMEILLFTGIILHYGHLILMVIQDLIFRSKMMEMLLFTTHFTTLMSLFGRQIPGCSKQKSC